MTKELSKQICEICGIKDNVDFGEPENFCKLIELKPLQTKNNLLGLILHICWLENRNPLFICDRDVFYINYVKF